MTTPTKLTDLFSLADVDAAIKAGHLVRREHATEPLAILNYTDRCAYEPGAWTKVTRQCRGLIYNRETLDVVARPFRKFFNWAQAEAPQVDPSSAVTVTDKLDGSLGVLYPTSTGLAVSTRGSFESEQAKHATALWRERYAHVVPPVGVTMLFEIVYPENRIVVDYAGMDDLILLCAIDIETGRVVSVDWPGPRAATLPYATLADALAATPRPNAEGIVVHILDIDERIKIKQEDYLKLHKIVTGLNERTVWEHISANLPLGDLLDPIPDEFHEWVQRVAHDLQARIESEETAIEIAYQEALAELPREHTRKDFAMRIIGHRWMHGIFARLDGKDYRPTLWRNAKPEARRTPTGVVRTEDAA